MDAPSKKLRGFFFLLTICFMYGAMIRISAVVLMPELARTLGMGAALTGFLASLFFYSFNGTMSLWGAVCDQMGSYRTCAAGMIIAAFGCAVYAVAASPQQVAAARILTGLGLSCTFIAATLHAAVAFPKERFPLYMSIVLTVGNLGTVIAVAPFGYAMDAFGISGLFTILGCFAAVMSLVFFLYRRDDPHGNSGESFNLKAVLQKNMDCLEMMRRLRPLWAIAVMWASIGASNGALQGLWAVAWLQESTGAPAPDVRMCVTWMSIGLMIGSMMGGFICRAASGKHRWLWGIALSIQGTLCAWCAAAWWGVPLPVMSVIGFAVGMTNGWGMVFGGNAFRELAPISSVGTVIGIANVLIFVMVTLFQWGTGAIIEAMPGQAGYVTAFIAVALVQTIFFLPAVIFKN